MSISAPSVYTCTPRQAIRIIPQVLSAGLVPFLQSSPGMGKSTIIRQMADLPTQYGEPPLWLIDHRLSTSEPVEMNGYPQQQQERATFLPFDLFPLQGDEIPAGYGGWLLFFDEFNSAPRSVQAAAYKIILDRMVGQYHLHDDLVIAAAGNLATDRAIVNPLSTAMQSRLIHLEMRVDFEEWREDVAYAQGYDERIIAFLSRFPHKLMDFNPDHQDRTFCCPRTWEFVNRLIQGKDLDADSTIMLAGTITAEVAVEFVRFTEIYQELVTIEEIRKGPTTCRVPSDPSLQYATIIHMVEHTSHENFADLAAYVERLPPTMGILYFRLILQRHPQEAFDTNPLWGAAMARLNGRIHQVA